jgi:hypothetical protein
MSDTEVNNNNNFQQTENFNREDSRNLLDSHDNLVVRKIMIKNTVN